MAGKEAENVGLKNLEKSGSHRAIDMAPSNLQRRPGSLNQKRVYLFLEWPSPVCSLMYHILMCLWFLALLSYGIYITGQRTFDAEATANMNRALTVMEILTHIWLTVDLALRFWSSSCRRCFQGCIGKLRFCIQFFSIMDILCLIIGWFVIILGAKQHESHGYGNKIVDYSSYSETSETTETTSDPTPETFGFTLPAMNAILFVQILRLHKFARFLRGSRIILSVLAEHRQVLLTNLLIGFLGFLIFPYLVFVSEKDSDVSHFRTYADTLWWSVITLTTVGYGDSRPIGILGKAWNGFAALFGVLVLFVPAAVIGAGIVKKSKENRSLEKKCKGTAASLIQSQWRMTRNKHVRDNVGRAIMIMKLLAAKKKFRNARQPAEIFAFRTSAVSHELICATESRMILMEKSMASLQAKLDQLLQPPRFTTT